jgi:hypothetical protein
MIQLALIPVISQTISELFKFGGSLRKETIALGLSPAIVMMYNSMAEACTEACTWQEMVFAPSGPEWAAVILGVITMLNHLNGKRKETIKQGE